jgi:hypothetical protein
MDGRGRWMDNVFIERLWRSLKYEDIYLKGYADGREAKAGIALWITFYNGRRPHQALGNRTPMAVCARGHDRRARHSGCGHDGQRKSAHRPTASATNLRYDRLIEAETETAKIPIKTAHVVIPMGPPQTSGRSRQI